MGYYCTVPQCTSLAGKTKNVKFHRFPRDDAMADKWNVILKRGKPITKYSKVCSLHFTQADYNVTTMGQWKTLSKDAIPSQNLPKLNADGSVMVIRKNRSVNKYKESRKDDISKCHQDASSAGPNSTHLGTEIKQEKWSPSMNHHPSIIGHLTEQHSEYQDTSHRLSALNTIASFLTPVAVQFLNTPVSTSTPTKPKKQDAIMQTEPSLMEDDDQSSQMTDEYNPEPIEYPAQNEYQKQHKDYEQTKNYDTAKDYTKTSDYIPQTNEEYNKEAEKYALERKSHNGYEKNDYNKTVLDSGYSKLDNEYNNKLSEYSSYSEKSHDYVKSHEYNNREYNTLLYHNGYQDTVELLRNQQHNLQMLQDPHRTPENQNFFNENHIKQEIDLNGEDDKFMYERSKEQLESTAVYTTSTSERELALQQHRQQRLLDGLPVPLKQEPDTGNGCENVVQPQGSPYSYTDNSHNSTGTYYDSASRPGPELLIAKQNALAAHTHFWQNSVKKPFFYSDTTYYPTSLHRYEDIPRILQ